MVFSLGQRKGLHQKWSWSVWYFLRYFLNTRTHTVKVINPTMQRISRFNKKDRWDSEKPRRQQILFCDIQNKVVISRRQIYVYHMKSSTTQNLTPLDFDLSRSLKVKYEGAIGLPIYAFLLMFNSNIGPNHAPLRDTRLRKSWWPWA